MTPQEQPDSQDRADELANLIKSELGDSQALPNNADSGKNILNPPKVGQDSQAGDEQTETDELHKLIEDFDKFPEQGSMSQYVFEERVRAWSRQQTAQVLDSLIKTDAHTFTVGAIKAARAGLYRHTGGTDMSTERPDGTQGDLESPTAPAEALRQQISEELSRAYYNGLDKKGWSIHEEKEGIENIMELVTAYAATVEREAELKGRVDELKHLDSLTYSFMSLGNDFDYSYRQSAVDDRLAALQGPPDGSDGLSEPAKS